jgi:hypothetical protein
MPFLRFTPAVLEKRRHSRIADRVGHEPGERNNIGAGLAGSPPFRVPPGEINEEDKHVDAFR